MTFEDSFLNWVNDQHGMTFYYYKNKLNGQRFVGDREEWYKDGKFHREDGPAIIWRGLQAWYLNGKYLKIIPHHVLVGYMQVNGYTAAHLLIDPDPLVRKSAALYKWDEETMALYSARW